MIYLGTVIFMSILFRLLFEGLLDAPPILMDHVQAHGVTCIGNLSAVLLSLLLAGLSTRRLLRRLYPAAVLEADLVLKVQGMSCQHCVFSVRRALEGFEAADEAVPDLDSGLMRVSGERLDATALVAAIRKAGFDAESADAGRG
ncbi:heavy-metal-associated domain-containing protein [Thiorhodococcus fuscus]|uniref:Heavy-metal-associated domain-containing protein n=1 Tax=Thiorhodococcus fuscus TaxID=527200 RepID=A0ABW4Y8E4_9GAMM